MRSIETPQTTPKNPKTPQTATKNHYRIYSQYHIMRKKCLGHSRPLRGGGGGSWVRQWLFARLHTLIGLNDRQLFEKLILVVHINVCLFGA